MYVIEKIAKTIRRILFLSHTDIILKTARPFYNRVLNALYGRCGLERIINGTDRILIPVKLSSSLGEDYEPGPWNYLMNHVKPGDVVADIGANMGLYSIALAHRVGQAGKVYAFEPDAANYKELQELIRLNNVEHQVEPMKIAVGNKDGIVEFCSGSQSISHMNYEKTDEEVMSVPSISLDRYFSNRQLDIIKIDIEGSEGCVLEGAMNLLTHNILYPRCILIEAHVYAWKNYDTDLDTIKRYLKRYNCKFIDRHGNEMKDTSFYFWIYALRKQEG